MGRPKALLPWGDVGAHGPFGFAQGRRAPLLIEYQVRELLAAGVDDLIVVLGHAAEEIRPHVPSEASTGSARRVRVVVNEAYRQGRASSLRAGAKALPDDADPILVLNVDQPRPRDVLAKLLAAHRRGGDLITVPAYRGKRGHPPVLAGSLLPELREASEEARGLRGVIAAHEGEVGEAAIESPVVLLDINTEEEYQRALAEFGLSSS
ncbi:MAG: hypothetical protein A2148_05270 [Chloroflexi bacterium RBG_16_68_14]|nr:MAG: hypothetical protein A2148_05270 [Chloroflexi bacterium RBG_16_68_14]